PCSLHSFPTRRSSDLCRSISPVSNPATGWAMRPSWEARNEDFILDECPSRAYRFRLTAPSISFRSLPRAVRRSGGLARRREAKRSEEHTSELQSRFDL